MNPYRHVEPLDNLKQISSFIDSKNLNYDELLCICTRMLNKIQSNLSESDTDTSFEAHLLYAATAVERARVAWYRLLK